MTESLDASAADAPAKKRTGGLNSMLLADLKAMAGGMGISGAGSMKKAQLIEAIKAAQSGQAGAAPKQAETPRKDDGVATTGASKAAEVQKAEKAAPAVAHSAAR